MTRTFVISDTHFGHRNILTFKDNEGNLIRGKHFSTIEEHDEYIINQWNSTVNKGDTVYHLGDVAINRKSISLVGRLNGRRILIKGNHDIFKLKDYAEYFEDIRAYKVMPAEGIILSHIPIHPDCMSRLKLNIHGHLHQNRVRIWPWSIGDDLTDYKYSKDTSDKRYMCVSMEHLEDYKPLNLQSVIDKIREGI